MFEQYLSNSKKYYDTPPQEVFDDIKEKSIEIWKEVDPEDWDEGVSKIEPLQNIRDNAWYIVALFDHINQTLLWGNIKQETRAYIKSIKGLDE